MKDRSDRPQWATSIREARIKRSLSQIQLAKKIGITNVSLSQIENGAANPSIYIVKKIADKLNYRIKLIFEEWV